MNFVLHFHLASRALSAPAAAAGAMLPDFWRMVDRRVRPKSGVERSEGVLGDVLAGIGHHLAIDRVFHASEQFTRGERLAIDALSGIGAPKLAIFAHVAWEIALDGALVRHLGAERAIASVRAGLDLATTESPSAADRAASLHHFDRIARSDDERAAFDARMGKLVRAIAEGPWIAGYADPEGLTARLEGVRSRFALHPLLASQRASLVDAMRSLSRGADVSLASILSDRAFL